MCGCACLCVRKAELCMDGCVLCGGDGQNLRFCVRVWCLCRRKAEGDGARSWSFCAETRACFFVFFSIQSLVQRFGALEGVVGGCFRVVRVLFRVPACPHPPKKKKKFWKNEKKNFFLRKSRGWGVAGVRARGYGTGRCLCVSARVRGLGAGG